MNKIILNFINKFMIKHQDEIVEVITNPDGDLSKQWIEQGNSVKEHLGLMEERLEEMNNGTRNNQNSRDRSANAIS